MYSPPFSPVVCPSKGIKALISKSEYSKNLHKLPDSALQIFGFPYSLFPKITLFRGLFYSKRETDGLYTTEPKHTQKTPAFLLAEQKSKPPK
jgi:hypothetical protein